MQIAVLGIDLGKNSCSVAGLDSSGAVIKRRRMRPDSIAAFTERQPPCIVAMEACCGAHRIGRLLVRQGQPSPPDVPGVCPAVTAMRKPLRRRPHGQPCGSSS